MRRNCSPQGKICITDSAFALTLLPRDDGGTHIGQHLKHKLICSKNCILFGGYLIHSILPNFAMCRCHAFELQRTSMSQPPRVFKYKPQRNTPPQFLLNSIEMRLLAQVSHAHMCDSSLYTVRKFRTNDKHIFKI